MEDAKIFTIDDCIKSSGYNDDYEGKIIVMKLDTLKKEYHAGIYQLWLAQHGNGCCPTARGRMVKATCLYDGDSAEWRRENFFGTIKPEQLPDWARLKLSQMRLHLSSYDQEKIPKYRGYSFLKDGRYDVGVELYSEKEVKEYIELQKTYQHRVIICDQDDFCVFEMIEGEIIHPSKEVIEAYQTGNLDNSMNMKL